jgi:hypothetical protein
MKTIKRKPKGYWTIDRIKAEALMYLRRKDFEKGSNSAYQIAIRLDIMEAVCSHMEPSQSEAYTVEDIVLAASKYNKRNNFKKGNRGEYAAACKRGKKFMDGICIHMSPPLTEAYTIEELQLEANKYAKRGDFYLGSPSAYAVAQSRQDFDKICSHMEEPANKAWLLEELQFEANKYLTPGEFLSGSSGAYHTAIKRADYLEICKHMKFSGCSSLLERKLFGIIKHFHPTTKKIRDRNVKIENKPYIHGFEIDIFVPELNKGIEFDGKHYHSFMVMRADKRKKLWSDDDIRNYHQLKDDWFASKGIKILHIKEVDWNINKEACVKRCLDFLLYG